MFKLKFKKEWNLHKEKMDFEDGSKVNGKTIVTLSNNIDYKAIDVIEDIKKKERLNLENKLKTQQTKPKTSKYGLCKVCKDTASGIHYGIAACDGCKVNKSL